mgnify:CR=1 FL=1
MKINVTYLDSIDLKLGDIVEITGVLDTPSSNTVFNLYNYRLYLMSNKIYHTLKANSIKKISSNKNIFYSVKNYIYERIDTLNSKAYLKTFILGDKSSVSDNMKTIYQENGISHLLAISGMHITLFSNLLDKIFAKFKKKHLIISLFLIFYAFLTNFTSSVIRAVVLYIFKDKDSKKTIIFLASILLIYNPYYIYNTGFVFSFTISFYLILFSYKINKYNNYLVQLFITSIISFFASIPILINNFNSINIMTPIINLIFVPFISFIIFPLSIIVVIIPKLDFILVIFVKILEFLSQHIKE